MSLRSLSIANRTLSCFGLLVVLVVSLGLFGLLQLSQLHGHGVMIETHNVPSIVEADNLALQLARTRTEVLRLLAMSDAPTVASTRKKIKEIDAEVQAGFGRYEKLIDSDRERQAFDNLRQVHRDYVRDTEQVAELVGAGKLDEARSFVQSNMAQLGPKMNDQTEVLRKVNQEDIQAASQQSDHTYAQGTFVTWVAIGLALGLTLLLAWRLTLSLTRPIAEAVTAAKTIASGDLTQTLDTRGHDEAAQLLQAMQQMQT
ncbi:MCP four helix bundle domain-containing protein, partial [Pseudomonas oryzihabitans]|uniref:MCP four helix bundle domain-containing protein n=1 Tax=Pseudomonas oryzihabitans TaxID=47885 RepID=UPI0011AB01D3